MPKFHLQRYGTAAPAEAQSFVLTTDNWDDFGHKTQFHLFFVDDSLRQRRIGAVKILQDTDGGSPPAVALSTQIHSSFEQLGERYISLGQQDEYYKRLFELCGSSAAEVLEALRDIAWRPSLSVPFEPTTAFRNSLMRENGAHRARRFGLAWALGEEVQEQPSFTYSCRIPGAEAPIDASIRFDPEDPLPGRIVGIIGRNAVGKTRFLAELGSDLAQVERASAERLAAREGRFPHGRPLFTRVLAISYSAFDKFRRPSAQTAHSYVYCGIRNERGALSRASLVDGYRKNQERIRQLHRESEWTKDMQRILGDQSPQLAQSLMSEISEEETNDESLSLLSSGQAILCHFTTAILAWIQPNSLVLFDEPETHLHPNAVATLFVVLSSILENYDSYCLLATHSPLVIQEIPSKRVLVFSRQGNVTTATELEMESFGESISELTRHVFETIEIEPLYRTTLRHLARTDSIDDLLARFEKGLGLSAEAYVLAQKGSNQSR